jgi:DNA primase
MVERFALGYAPDRWDGLMRHLLRQRISENLQLKAGLVIPRKKGTGCYDRFRNRIVFPIRDSSGRVIGFGGRVMDDALPKYLNSPETPVYNKSRSLYGIFEARQACRKREAVFVVEGYLDAIALHQHGIDNTVATLGTALTLEHVRVLRGLVGESGVVYLVYDSDNAGMKAAERSVAVFSKGHAQARILVLPEGYDPDAYIFEFGAESFIQEVEKAQTIVTFLIDAALKRYGRSIEGRANAVADLAPRLAVVEDGVKRALYIRELAEKTGVDETVVLQRVQQAGHDRRRDAVQTSDHTAAPQMVAAHRHRRHNRMESRIVAMMLQYPRSLPEVRDRNLLDLFGDERLKSIGRIVLERCEVDPGRVPIEIFDDQDSRNLAAALTVSEDDWSMEGCHKLIHQFETTRRRRSGDLVGRIREAEQKHNNDLVMDLLKEKQRHAMRIGRKSEELRRPD